MSCRAEPEVATIRVAGGGDVLLNGHYVASDEKCGDFTIYKLREATRGEKIYRVSAGFQQGPSKWDGQGDAPPGGQGHWVLAVLGNQRYVSLEWNAEMAPSTSWRPTSRGSPLVPTFTVIVGPPPPTPLEVIAVNPSAPAVQVPAGICYAAPGTVSIKVSRGGAGNLNGWYDASDEKDPWDEKFTVYKLRGGSGMEKIYRIMGHPREAWIELGGYLDDCWYLVEGTKVQYVCELPSYHDEYGNWTGPGVERDLASETVPISGWALDGGTFASTAGQLPVPNFSVHPNGPDGPIGGPIGGPMGPPEQPPNAEPPMGDPNATTAPEERSASGTDVHEARDTGAQEPSDRQAQATTESEAPRPSRRVDPWRCVACGADCGRSGFSRNQLSKGRGKCRCKGCVASVNHAGSATNAGSGSTLPVPRTATAAASQERSSGVPVKALRSFPSLAQKSLSFLAKASAALSAEGIDSMADLEHITLETLRASPVPALVVDALWKPRRDAKTARKQAAKEKKAMDREKEARRKATCTRCQLDTRSAPSQCRYHPGPHKGSYNWSNPVWLCCGFEYDCNFPWDGAHEDSGCQIAGGHTPAGKHGGK